MSKAKAAIQAIKKMAQQEPLAKHADMKMRYSPKPLHCIWVRRINGRVYFDTVYGGRISASEAADILTKLSDAEIDRQVAAVERAILARVEMGC